MNHESRLRASQGVVRHGRLSIPFQVYGQRDGIPVVCVSGWLCGIAHWRMVVDQLRDRVPVVVVDLPGQRWASELSDPVEALDHVMQSVCGSGPVDVIGMSWGSVVASLYATRAECRVRRLLLASLCLQINPMQELLPEKERPAVIDGEMRRDDLLAAAFGHRLPLGIGARIRAQWDVTGSDPVRALREQLPWFREAPVAERIDLSRIRAQTLVVVGGRDRFSVPENAVRAQHGIPDCSVAVIPEAGHFLHLEQPGILSLYRRFLLEGKTIWASRSGRVASAARPMLRATPALPRSRHSHV